MRISNNKRKPAQIRTCANTKFWLLAVNFLFINLAFSAAQENHLAAFSDPSMIWGNGVERVIEEAYRQCFKTMIFSGRVMNVRVPFAQNNLRDVLTETEWGFLEGGKGAPEILWPVVEEILATEDFEEYLKALSSGREQVFIFDIPTQTWRTSSDLFDIARMKAGSYRGLPHRPYVLTSGRGAQESDIYNYLFCVGRVGMDCSGFVWFILSHVAKQGGMDLGRTLSRDMGVPRGGDPAWYAGTAFFNSKSSQIISVKDEIRNLRPADIILFRDTEGRIGHSVIIQSIDFKRGVIRYLQCTEEAPIFERGVHESFIFFDPANPRVSLSDQSLRWSQKRFSPFPGEEESAFSDDGIRYRTTGRQGGGRVVRIKALEPVIERLGR